MALDGVQAREMEDNLLGETTGDVADAFRAITAMVVE